ncbi:efflux RND transporter permease subunit [Sneathiella limimaris]|uniref:efflux RND transporter permease subunit n=1 Tax=Sneathiella limimaris TaxID=1964213 RepID=UPI00146DBBB3|nr:efflux RND transporter permease subunit [Sneathiella limimaris]
MSEPSSNPLSNGLPGISVRRPYLAVVMNLLIMIAGFGALLGIEVRELPNIDRPIVSVYADYPGASPETVDAEATSTLEAAISRVNGIKEVRSSSEENNLRIRAIFNPTIDLAVAANDVREAVSRAERELPDEVENIRVIKADADASSIINLAVWSDRLSIDELTRVVENQIVPELTAVEGVATVNLFGDQEQVLRVRIDPLRLASFGLSVADVANTVRNARFDVPAGSFSSNDQEVLVRANASVTKPELIEELYIKKPIRIGDVASVYYSPAEAQSWVRLNNRRIVSLGIVRQASSNTIEISNGVSEAVSRMEKSLKGVTIETISDESLFIESAIEELLVTLGYTILIVVAVIILFTMQVRSSFIPTLAVPVALVGSLAAIWALGFSINLITLLAMVLATGAVVDDAIVVLENIQRLRAKGIKSSAAAVLGTRQVFFAVIATTATLISVFVPISFLPSEAGRLFREFGFVLAITVAISSFVALTLVPMLVSKLPDRSSAEKGPLGRFYDNIGKSLLGFYKFLLDRSMHHPIFSLIICLAIIATGYQTYQMLKEELVPEEDRGRVTVFLTGPDGMGLTYTDRQVAFTENLFRPYLEDGVVTRLYSITGRWDLNRGIVEAPLVDWSERDISEGEIAKDLNKKLRELPGARAFVLRRNSLNLRNANGGLQFALLGASYPTIFDEANGFVRDIEENLPWITNMRVEFRATQPELTIEINRVRAADLGVNLDDLATMIQVLIDEKKIAELILNDQSVPIILQASNGTIRQPSDISNLYVTASDGRLVPLTQLVTFHESSVAAELDRHAQRRAIEISADISSEYTLRDAVDAVRELAFQKLSPEVSLIYLGEAKALEETSHDIYLTFAIALVVVFLVLVAQFESITSAMVVLLTVPLGLCAAVFALYLSGTSLNIYSQIGVLMLIGIMAKNAILMVEFADQLREQGYSPFEAAREASLVRLRPIMMTMVSTVTAGLPLILGSGAGVEARNAIGWVIFGGLGVAGVITLFVAPVLYSKLAGFSKPRSHAHDLLTEELKEAGKIH